MGQSFTATDAEDAKEDNSLDAKDAGGAEEDDRDTEARPKPAFLDRAGEPKRSSSGAHVSEA